MVAVTLSLGSNLGDSLNFLFEGVRLLKEFGFVVKKVSPCVVSEALGGPVQGKYFNLVVLGESFLLPEVLLNCCQRVEFFCGRVRTVRWGARTLDIDIIMYGNLVQETPRLVLPHPRAFERSFVLFPWHMVDSFAYLPGYGFVSKLLVAAQSKLEAQVL